MKPEHKRILTAAHYLCKKDPKNYISRENVEVGDGTTRPVYYLNRADLWDKIGLFYIEPEDYSPIEFPWQKANFRPKEPKMKDGKYYIHSTIYNGDEVIRKYAIAPDFTLIQDRTFQRNPPPKKTLAEKQEEMLERIRGAKKNKHTLQKIRSKK